MHLCVSLGLYWCVCFIKVYFRGGGTGPAGLAAAGSIIYSPDRILTITINNVNIYL